MAGGELADVAVVDVEAEEVAATDVGGGGEASGSLERRTVNGLEMCAGGMEVGGEAA